MSVPEPAFVNDQLLPFKSKDDFECNKCGSYTCLDEYHVPHPTESGGCSYSLGKAHLHRRCARCYYGTQMRTKDDTTTLAILAMWL